MTWPFGTVLAGRGCVRGRGLGFGEGGGWWSFSCLVAALTLLLSMTPRGWRNLLRYKQG